MTRWLSAFVVGGLVAWPCGSAQAAESVSLAKSFSSSSEQDTPYLLEIPADAKNMAPVLRHLVGVVQSAIEVTAAVKQLRIEQDATSTKLAAVNSEEELVAKHEHQLVQQLSAAEADAKQRFHTLRSNLESRLSSELLNTRDQINAQRQLDFSRELERFEARQRDIINKAIDQEMDMKERELDQLSQEIDVQTQELTERLGRLDTNPEIAKSVERSTRQALAKRRAELEDRRHRVAVERTDLFNQRRAEFMQGLTAQLAADAERRLKIKEATLRSTMAELLKKSEKDEAGKVERVRAAAEEARERHNRVLQQQALLTTRRDVIAQELTAKTRMMERLDGERQKAVDQFEESFAPLLLDPDALAWLGRSIRYMPPEVASELLPLQKRLIAAAEQEERLRQQKRLVYERQMAVQLSREMEEKRRAVEEQQQREQQERFRQAEKLLDQARDFAKRGDFEAAIELLVRAQALNPPQLAQIEMARDQYLTQQQQRSREQHSAQIERLFNQAMSSFDQGDYEEAVALFEQVIAQEARIKGSRTVVGGKVQ